MKNVAINRKQVHLVGGSVTLLRNKIIKEVDGGSLSANKIIGITSPAPSNERVLSGGDIPIRRRGGDLLNHIIRWEFEHSTKTLLYCFEIFTKSET